MARFVASQRRLQPTAIGGRWFCWGERTFIMGVLNVTPDSFSGDGVGTDVTAAVRRSRELEAGGADIIDIGGESTRPGHQPISVEEELARVLPAVRAVAERVGIPISVDSRKAAVASAAVKAGAALINDVSGLMADPAMAATVQELDVPVVVMARGHSRHPDVVRRVREDLDEGLARAAAAAIAREKLLIDPGFGFGKDWRQNLALLARLAELREYDLPLLAGLSRKSTIVKVLGSEREHRIPANAALTALAIAGGADMVRIHDVAELRAAVQIADAVVRVPGVEAAPGSRT